jgi:hypothetical protein
VPAHLTGCMAPVKLRLFMSSCFALRDPNILHMTLARVLKPPVASGSGADALQQAVAAMTSDLCGTQTTLQEIW